MAAFSAGSGSDTLVLNMSERAWRGDAQFTVSVDNKQVGGTFTTKASHDAGRYDTLTLKGDWATGDHQVSVKFLNDAYGGTWNTDRNLYVEKAAYNGTDLGVHGAYVPGWPALGFSFHDGAAAPSPPAPTPTPTPPPVKPTGPFSAAPVWSDEFNDTTIDRSKWTNLFDGGSWDNNGFRWSPNQLSESGGSLHIGIDRQADGVFNVGGMAAYETSSGGFGFDYGKVEIRAKASEEVTGAGMCLLLWPEHDDHWPPEVDILETPKGDGLFTNHWQGPGGNGDNVQENIQFPLDYAQWHTYGLEWTPDRLTMLVDGQAVKTYTTHVPTEAMSVAVMGYVGAPSQTWYGGAPAANVTHVGIDVDFVHVYDYIG